MNHLLIYNYKYLLKQGHQLPGKPSTKLVPSANILNEKPMCVS